MTIIGRALQIGDVIRDNARLRSELGERYSFDQLIGSSPPFRKVLNQIAEVSSSRAIVLITGESGTGKELVARAIHFNSPRQSKPFVVVNCAAIPEGLLESELFGHVKGAFTGAISARQGRFALATGGSLFLDEIGDMPITIQAKVLRVLQEQAFEPVGSTRTVEVDVRIIAATHKDLRRSVTEGGFREDLFYRLNVYPIEVPPLRERGDDVQILASYFLRQHADSMGKKLVGFTPAASATIAIYHWPGNVRELQNCIERAVIVAAGSTVDLPDLPPYVFENPPRSRERELPRDLDAALAGIEKEFILRALRESEGVQVRAAERLGIAERSLWHRIKKLGITITKAAAP
jgi:two-component system response regulator AtoC